LLVIAFTEREADRNGGPLMGVLIIADDPAAIRTLTVGLEGKGFAVSVALNTDDGFRMAWKSRAEIIILDVLVSPEGSFSLLKTWRQAGLTTPILALVAPTDAEDPRRTLDMGADACLTKPFAFKDLLARIKALARCEARPENPVLAIDDLEIDSSIREVRRAGRPIPLTPREFSLLQFLAQHRGKVVSRSMIRQHLYDDKLPNTSNVVDVYIRYLRNKIDKGFPRPLIQTRWGEGYLLRAEEI
jgi:DNA-binding response OmpR family regulator